MVRRQQQQRRKHSGSPRLKVFRSLSMPLSFRLALPSVCAGPGPARPTLPGAGRPASHPSVSAITALLLDPWPSGPAGSTHGNPSLGVASSHESWSARDLSLPYREVPTSGVGVETLSEVCLASHKQHGRASSRACPGCSKLSGGC